MQKKLSFAKLTRNNFNYLHSCYSLSDKTKKRNYMISLLRVSPLFMSKAAMLDFEVGTDDVPQSFRVRNPTLREMIVNFPTGKMSIASSKFKCNVQ